MFMDTEVEVSFSAFDILLIAFFVRDWVNHVFGKTVCCLDGIAFWYTEAGPRSYGQRYAHILMRKPVVYFFFYKTKSYFIINIITDKILVSEFHHRSPTLDLCSTVGLV